MLKSPCFGSASLAEPQLAAFRQLVAGPDAARDDQEIDFQEGLDAIPGASEDLGMGLYFFFSMVDKNHSS